MKKCINRRCNKELEDNFLYCPWCGKSQQNTIQKRRRTKGTGSIYVRKDNKSHPYSAASTVTGKQVYIGCYATKTEAEQAIREYENNPTPSFNFTLQELHDQWQPIAYRNIGKSTRENYDSAWSKLKPLYGRKMRDLRTGDLQAIIDYYDAPHQKVGAEGKLMYSDADGKGTYRNTGKILMCDGLKYSALHKIKCLLTKMYTYALQNDIVNKNYATFIILPDKNETSKTRLTELQVEIVKQNIDKVPFADYIYCLCYLNFRISEFLELKPEDYHVSESGVPLFIGGKKTDAGTDRMVPIHPKIQNIVSKCLKKGGETIFCDVDGSALNVQKFRKSYFYPAMEAMQLPGDLTPHSCRRTFSTRMSAAGARKEDIIALMGHTNFDVDIDHYINQEADTLYKAIKLMA